MENSVLEPLPGQKTTLATETRAMFDSVEDSLRNPLRDNAVSAFKEMASLEFAAARELIYACFGLKLIHATFKGVKAVWKAYLKKEFPKQVKSADIYLAIANHFKYDEKYFKFLDSIDYPVRPSERLDLCPVATQLKELNLRNRRDLFINFSSSNKNIVSEVKSFSKAAALKTDSIEKKNSVLETPNPEEDELRIDPEILYCDKRLEKLITRIPSFTGVMRAFDILKERHPIDQWDPVKVQLLKQALLPAKLILEQLP